MNHPALLLCALLVPAAALAQDRPSEDDLFGKPPEAAPAATPAPARPPAPGAPAAPAPAAPAASTARDDEQLGGGASKSGASTAARLDAKASEDPLKLGGQLYLRSALSAREDQPPSQWYLSSPNLADLWLDARPNDRVRGFVLGRLAWDPTVNQGEPGQFGFTQGSATSIALDQLWVAFDVGRTLFVTAGRQHVKWGTGHFWSPTDWLHPVRRDPLALFDSRTGTTMLRLHLPWEKMGWSLTGVALLEGAVQGGAQVDPQTGGSGSTSAGTPSGTYANADRLGKVAGALRAEVVLGPAEIGLDLITRRGGGTKGGIDFSAGIWELDVYGDLALKTGSDVPLFECVGPCPQVTAGTDPLSLVLAYRASNPTGLTPAMTLGVSWSLKYSDEDSLTLGAEYFYNHTGYDDPKIYPYLLGQQLLNGVSAFNPFYLGRHYAGVYLLLPKPGSWNDTTITVSTLGDLSDRSFISRLDWQVTWLTYLSIEAYGQVHYGNAEGEFRLGLDLPSYTIGTTVTPALHLPPPTFDVGLNLRLRI